MDSVNNGLIYVYLRPEVNEKWYITLGVTVMILVLISIMIWAFKKYWELNTCDLGPSVGIFYGLSSRDWTETCINAPLAGTISEIKHSAKIEKNDAIKPLKELLTTIKTNIKKLITKTKVATKQLKESKNYL